MTKNPTNFIESEEHRDFLRDEALKQLNFFKSSLCPTGGFYSLDDDGSPIENAKRELHATTRMIHCFSLSSIAGWAEGAQLVDHGFQYLMDRHRDPTNGGFFWSTQGASALDNRKLAYGHVFVLLAAASATAAGHPDASKLLDEIDHILDQYFWDEDRGLFKEEWSQDWHPISKYRGMNANMHGVEALLAAYEATGRTKYLERAERIIDFFVGIIAPSEHWRIPEHYDESWQIDRAYEGNQMFRPWGTTPGHSFEFGRLLLQFNELNATPKINLLESAQKLVQTALCDAWDKTSGGVYYTLNFDGLPAIRNRYWWPVTEAIGVIAAFLKVQPNQDYLDWYRLLWDTAARHFIDHERGGWYPEVDSPGAATPIQFVGKPDLYHSLQAALLPLTPSVANVYDDLDGILSDVKCLNEKSRKVPLK
jgi:mannose/cellobiose epimerase-like protein (N-acyl-D-glucosamine 2-epimerase family)